MGRRLLDVTSDLDLPRSGRIRTLGYPAPTSLRAIIKDSRISEAKGDPPAEEMVDGLVADHDTMRHLRETTDLTDELHDQGAADMLIDRMRGDGNPDAAGDRRRLTR